MSVRIVRHAHAAAFLERAEPWLLRAEAEHNLLLGIAAQLRSAMLESAPDLLLATIELDGEVAGCAFRTPPFKLGLTRMPVGAAAPLADTVGALYDTIPAVLGPEPSVAAFADVWCSRHHVTAAVGMRQRIYQLTRVVTPAERAAGELRVATPAQLPLVRDWIAAFTDEAAHGVPVLHDPAPKVKRGDFYFWYDADSPRTLVGVGARTPNGARVGPVYTPPAERGHGYASAATAALSQRLLDEGRTFCFLYTDLANPTSNSIYQRIGYQPVSDVIDVVFDGR